jgi:hypothetical protein
MAPQEGLIGAIDLVIEDFNRRRMDLPDGFFDRKAQFVINGAPFETLLSSAPNDPLILMLARGPAGYRFTAKALQHAIPDVKLERGEVAADGDSPTLTTKLWVSGRLRDSGEPLNALVSVTLRLASSGSVQTAEATMDAADLDRIRKARMSK